jgi:hypothetical protein
MALKIVTPKLIVNHLVLVGSRKNYEVNFKEGLNIIYGDSDTGKSSILNLINYCLGSNKVDFYDEIEITGKYCLLEVALRGIVYTIRRDIFKPNNEIEVFKCSYDKIDEFFPQYFSPNYSKTSEDGYFSDFLLSSMNIPIIKLKEAPTKHDSKMVRLSFRDIFKYNFLDQDKIGSKKIFGDNPVLIVKLKETFKLMYNVLDTQILELESIITEKINLKKELENKNKSVSSFLKETEIESLKDLTLKLESIDGELVILNDDLKIIDKDIIKDSEDLNYLRKEIQQKESEISEISQDLNVNQQEIRQNIALRNEYSNDIRKVIATLEVIDKLPRIEDRQADCPVCEQTMSLSKLKEHFTNSDATSIKGELNGLRRRKKEIAKIYDVLKESIENKEYQIKTRTKELEELRYLLDKQSIDIVSPFINRRDALSHRAGNLESDRKNLKHFYKIRIQQSINDDEIKDLDGKINEHNETLKTLKENAPKLDDVFKVLGLKLKDFVNFVGVKNAQNVTISPKTYLPNIRNREYEQITSGGVRTITSVGYFISLMLYASENSVNYPSFLMTDTIAKYIGKTKDKDLVETDIMEDIAEGMNDSKKYENMYRYLISLNKSSNSFQMIIVDNDIPENLTNDLKPYIRKHYTINSKIAGAEIGFINDASPVENSKSKIKFNDNLSGEIDKEIFFDEDDVE